MSSATAVRDDAHTVAVFSNIGHVCTHMFTLLYATAVLHLPQVFGLAFGEMLGLSSLGLVLFGVCALPAGWLGDRWSQVGMMVVFFLGIGVGAALTGLATTTTELFVGLTLMGAFASIYHPVGIAWLVATATRQGMTLGINGVFGGVGSAAAPVFVGAMIDWVSWRAAFLVPAVVAISVGVVLAWLWRAGRIDDARSDRTPAPPPDPGAMTRVFFILTLTMCASGFVYTGLLNTMPKLFEQGLGQALASSYTEIGLYAGGVVALASVSSFFGGWLADRYSARAIYIVFWLLSAVPIFFIVSSTGVTLLLMAILALWFNTGFAAAENMLVARYTPFKWRALAYGAKFVLALGVGGLTVRVAGELFDSSGSFDVLYFAFAAAAVASAMAAMLLPRAVPRRELATA